MRRAARLLGPAGRCSRALDFSGLRHGHPSGPARALGARSWLSSDGPGPARRPECRPPARAQLPCVHRAHERASRYGAASPPPMLRTYAATVRRATRRDTRVNVPRDAERGGSGAEAALALRVGAQRAQEVDPAEVGPVGLAEVELRCARSATAGSRRAAARPRCGSPGRGRAGPWCRGARRCARRRGPRPAPRCVVPCAGVLLQQRAHGVGDLAPAAVADGDVDQQARRRRGCGSAASLSARAVVGGQQVEGTDRVQPPAALRRRASSTASSMIPSSGVELASAAGSGCRSRAATA